MRSERCAPRPVCPRQTSGRARRSRSSPQCCGRGARARERGRPGNAGHTACRAAGGGAAAAVCAACPEA
eukprot:14367518-Alexandrium_andersonii.AAC.1